MILIKYDLYISLIYWPINSTISFWVSCFLSDPYLKIWLCCFLWTHTPSSVWKLNYDSLTQSCVSVFLGSTLHPAEMCRELFWCCSTYSSFLEQQTETDETSSSCGADNDIRLSALSRGFESTSKLQKNWWNIDWRCFRIIEVTRATHREISTADSLM